METAPMTNPAVELPELTDEQMSLLRARFIAENAAATVPDDDTQEAKEKKKEVWIFTNPRNQDVTITDLGVGNGRSFIPVSIGPFEVRNLRTMYTAKELRKSHYLRKAVQEGLLVEGELTKEQMYAEEDPLVVLAKANPRGTFTDPMSGDVDKKVPGTRYYDEQLKKAIQKDREDDEETRQV